MIARNRRSILAGLGGVAATLAASTRGAAVVPNTVSAAELDQIIAANEASQAALLRGDVSTFIAKIGGLSPDFLLMAPVGGEPSRAADYTSERMAQMGRFFRNGTLKQEVVATYAGRDMIVLGTIERAEVEVGGLPRQPWALRVTTVFVRRGAGWQMAHRHADPLVAGISLAESARLARAEPPAAN